MALCRVAREGTVATLQRTWGGLGFEPWRDGVYVLDLGMTTLDDRRAQLRARLAETEMPGTGQPARSRASRAIKCATRTGSTTGAGPSCAPGTILSGVGPAEAARSVAGISPNSPPAVYQLVQFLILIARFVTIDA